MRKKLSLSLISVLLFGISCVQPPEYPTDPVVEFLEISQTEVEGFPNVESDSIVIKFSFTDGDGDLGIKEDDTSSCLDGDSISFTQSGCNAFLIDSRTGYVYTYRVPYIQPRGNVKAISGEVEIKRYAPFFCNVPFGSDVEQDSMHFTIMLKDRMGNLSNEVKTPTIYINCN